MIDLLASTGMRVGELVGLDHEDINFYERECVVFGKGAHEHLVYFDARTKIHLMNYLDSRTDNNPTLFVSLALPHDRLCIGGVETRLREIWYKTAPEGELMCTWCRDKITRNRQESRFAKGSSA
jgi:site-specific recombinase XerD